MNKGKQATLFQSWGVDKSRSANSSRQQGERVRPTRDRVTAGPSTDADYTRDRVTAGPSTDEDYTDIIDLCNGMEDEDEDLLAQVLDTMDAPDYGQHTAGRSSEAEVCNLSMGAETFTGISSQTQTAAPEGFDKAAGKLWIYPTNYPVRDYQFNICQQSLYKNTMVTLPTGLGKTFIAAVVMYNFYRWYPQGKVVFMAPTKPLVAQQIEACYNIMGIPQTDTAEMTGNMAPTERQRTWQEKRVFFLTPQVLTNDLGRGTCPAGRVRCLVVDEAHKALGNHAYCQVVRELIKYTEKFRILALSATPGTDIKAVQHVLSNLLIAHIELRTEESIDIKQYTHERKVEKVVVPLGDELTRIKKKYIQVLDVVVGRLKRQGVLYNRETTSFSKFLILKAREGFRDNKPHQMQRCQYGVVEGDFALAMSLYHGLELLQQHGQRSLYNYLGGIMSGDKGQSRTRTELSKNADFNDMMDTLHQKFAPDPNIRPSQKYKNGFVSGHPKMDKLEEVVLHHFNTFTKGGTVDEKSRATRVMIFSQYRDSVAEITDILKQHDPMVKAMSFIGQSSTGKATKGFTQKEQLKVIKDFRDGGYNTLVSTCVGEEGLDIGEVDLIVCFDAHKSPIRLVQRIGRTGRKRQGHIIMLVSEGKEEQIYNQSQYSKRSIHKAILNGAKSLHFYQNNARMVPEGWHPPCHKMFISVKQNFQPKNAPKVLKDARRSKIRLQAKAGTDRSADDGLLTTEEHQDFLQNYSVPADSIRPLPSRTPLLSLGGEQEAVPVTGRCLLREWLPWQNRLQQTYKIDHSTKTKHFVEMMEFIEIQQTIDPKEDPYGDEMRLFLNEEDVLKPGEGSGKPMTGIRKFCVTVDKGGKETGHTSVKDKGRRLRKSEVLPVLEISESEDSDEELPDYNINGTKVHCDKLNKAQGNSHLKGRKSKHRLLPKCLPMLTESLAEVQVVGRKSKKDKKRSVSGDRSVVQLIADTDNRDFAVAEQNCTNVVPVAENTTICVDQNENRENKATSDNTNKYQEEMDTVEINYSPQHVHDHDQMEVDNMKEKDLSFSQLLPRVSAACSGKLEASENCYQYHVRTPPPVEQVGQIVAELDQCNELPPLDLLQLVDEWEKENQHYRNRKGESSTSHCKAQAGCTDSGQSESVIGQKNSSDREFRKMSKPLQDIHITRPSPPKVPTETFPGLQQSNVEKCSLKVKVPDPGKLNTEDTCVNGNVSVAKRKETLDNEEVLSDDSEDFIETQANFDLSVDVEDSKVNAYNDEKVNSPQTQNKIAVDIKMDKDVSDNDEKSSSESLDDFFDTQVNFTLQDIDVFGDVETESKYSGPNGSSSSVSDKSGTMEDERTLTSEERQRPIDKPSTSGCKVQAIDSEWKQHSDMNKNATSASGQKQHSNTDKPATSASGQKQHSNTDKTDKGTDRKDDASSNKPCTVSCRSADVSLFDDSYDTEMLNAIKTQKIQQGADDNSPAQFTFTQALACVHDSNELFSDHSDKDSDPVQLQAIKEAGQVRGQQNLPRIQEAEEKESHDNNRNNDTGTQQTDGCDKEITGKDTRASSPSQDLEKQCSKGNVDGSESGDDSGDECSSGSLDLPHFDLGFDIDEDFIPPSPCASQSMSQRSFSVCLSQSLLSTRKSLSTTLGCTNVSDASTHVKRDDTRRNSTASTVISNSEELDDVSVIKPVVIKTGRICINTITEESDESPVNLSNTVKQVRVNCVADGDCSSIKAIDCGPNMTNICKGTNESSAANKLGKTSADSSAKESSELSKYKSPGSRISMHKVNSFDKDTQLVGQGTVRDKTKLSHNNKKLVDASLHGILPINSDEVNEFKTGSLEVSTKELRDERKSSPDAKDRLSSDSDEELIARKKRKTMIIESPSPQILEKRQHIQEDNTPFRTPVRPTHGGKRTNSCISNLTTDESKKKTRKFNVSFRLPEEFNDDDDDFANDSSSLLRIRPVILQNKPGNVSSVKETKCVQKRRSKSKSPADMFIHAEADVSDDDADVSDDEAEGSDLDQMDDSFIGEATQMSQGQSEDMQAFYLKSVRSPKVGGKFRLKYDHNNMDVFSQPQHHEDSEYMNDSFCVDDDFEETGVDYDDEEEEETFVEAEDLEVTYVGRKTRWSKPVAIKKKKNVKNVSGRKRIRKMSDSSSEEECDKAEASTIRTPKVSGSTRRGRAVISSSDEDAEKRIVSPPAIISPPCDSQSTQDIMPSLMTRIKKNTATKSCLSELQTNNMSHSTSGKVQRNVSFTSSAHNSTLNKSDNTSGWLNTTVNRGDQSSCGLNKSLTAEQLRAQRLQKQKEKQEEFRKRMSEKVVENIPKVEDSSVIKSDTSKSRIVQTDVKSNCDMAGMASHSDCDMAGMASHSDCDMAGMASHSDCDMAGMASHSDELLLTTIGSKTNKKPVIFVDSREINSCQNITSELRFKHNMSVVVAQLSGCDYVVSNRMGVERKGWSEFTNGSNRAKLTDCIQQLCELYDRPCLIIEADPVKGSDKGGNHPLHWTKYVDKTIVHLINATVKMYFTSSRLDTAAILADLCQVETRKNMAISTSIPLEITGQKQHCAKFYASLPKLTYVHALNLAHNLSTIKDFLNGSVSVIRTKGCMSEQRARDVHSYVRRTFDIQMLPTSYGS